MVMAAAAAAVPPWIFDLDHWTQVIKVAAADGSRPTTISTTAAAIWTAPAAAAADPVRLCHRSACRSAIATAIAATTTPVDDLGRRCLRRSRHRPCRRKEPSIDRSVLVDLVGVPAVAVATMRQPLLEAIATSTAMAMPPVVATAASTTTARAIPIPTTTQATLVPAAAATTSPFPRCWTTPSTSATEAATTRRRLPTAPPCPTASEPRIPAGATPSVRRTALAHKALCRSRRRPIAATRWI
mmetsp:Transcript_10234/g.29177  ORF Transcript_10234/g.29177 Transcript_10234/m.29177 type:complete len:242 (-) Transcript_10234:1629-2354(-)